MRNGNYKINSFNFDTFKVNSFKPHLFYSGHHEGIGCGPATVSLLTGLSPIESIKVVNVNNTTDHAILRVLKKHGISYHPITKCEMTNSVTSIVNKLTTQHVILISQLWRRNEASWAVLYDEVLYHNFRPCLWTSLDLLNRPVLSAYVLWKPEWCR